jgi:hypothetical protein
MVHSTSWHDTHLLVPQGRDPIGSYRMKSRFMHKLHIPSGDITILHIYNLNVLKYPNTWLLWSRGLRRGSAAARLLKLMVSILPEP